MIGITADDTNRTLNYGNYGIFLMMGHAGFISSTVGIRTDLGDIGPLIKVPFRRAISRVKKGPL